MELSKGCNRNEVLISENVFHHKMSEERELFVFFNSFVDNTEFG